MDKKKSLLNVSTSMIFKVLILVFTILTKRYLIKYVGNEANGLNSLYLSLIGILSISELGIGTAITFCMYSPIVNNENEKVAALYKLFVKVYKIISIVILIAGIAIMPMLPYFAKGYNLDVNLYVTFGIMLLSIVLNYMFSAKTSLINAYKNDYVTTIISGVGMLVQQVGQIITLILFKSFEIYLVCRVISIVIQWIITELYTAKNYKEIINIDTKLDEGTRKQVIKSVKAMFMHKVGSLLVNTLDSVIISTFIGVAILGKYSNYIAIMSAMTSVLYLFFTPLTSSIGHLCSKGAKQKQKEYFNFFYALNFVLGVIFFLGYYSIINNVIEICFGKGLELSKDVCLVVTINYFIQFMRRSVLLFRDATGTFYNDRYKPLIEGVVNLILSILLVKVVGVAGVIVATIITNVFVCHLIEPYVLYKNVFKDTPKRFYVKNYLYIVFFAVLLIFLDSIMVCNNNIWINLIVNGIISISVSAIPVIMVFVVDRTFRFKVFGVCKFIKGKISKKQA